MGCCEKTNQYLPASIAAGLDFEARVTLADYPASEWTLAAIIRGPSAINLTAAADGDTFVFTAAAATTTGWGAGLYAYELRATKAGGTVQVDRGQLQVTPDLSTATAGYDPRSENEIALDAIKAVLAKRASLDQERYRINNRELYRTSIADLLRLKGYYAGLVRQEKACAKGRKTFGRPVYVRFDSR